MSKHFQRGISIIFQRHNYNFNSLLVFNNFLNPKFIYSRIFSTFHLRKNLIIQITEAFYSLFLAFNNSLYHYFFAGWLCSAKYQYYLSEHDNSDILTDILSYTLQNYFCMSSIGDRMERYYPRNIFKAFQ